MEPSGTRIMGFSASPSRPHRSQRMVCSPAPIPVVCKTASVASAASGFSDFSVVFNGLAEKPSLPLEASSGVIADAKRRRDTCLPCSVCSPNTTRMPQNGSCWTRRRKRPLRRVLSRGHCLSRSSALRSLSSPLASSCLLSASSSSPTVPLQSASINLRISLASRFVASCASAASRLSWVSAERKPIGLPDVSSAQGAPLSQATIHFVASAILGTFQS